jgi:hypothetical protein
MSTIHLAGLLLIAGPLSFFIGGGVTWKVWVQPDMEQMAQVITQLRPAWILGHILFLVGVVTVVIGLGVFTGSIEAANARTLAIVGLVAAVLGSLVWAYIVLAFRLSMSAEELVHTKAGAWTYPAFTVLTLGALVLFGIVLLVNDFPAWIGIATAGLSGLILIAFLARKNTIPALYYIAPLILGIALLS